MMRDSDRPYPAWPPPDSADAPTVGLPWRVRLLRTAYEVVYVGIAVALALAGLLVAFLVAAGWWMPRVLGVSLR